MRECVVEQIIANPNDLADAINSLRFFWNLARVKGEAIIIEVWANPRKESDSSQPLEVVPQGAD